MGLGVSDDDAAWLTEMTGYSTHQAGTGCTEAAPTAAPFVLLRLNCMQKLPGGGAASAAADVPTDGIMIWVDERPTVAPPGPAAPKGTTGQGGRQE